MKYLSNPKAGVLVSFLLLLLLTACQTPSRENLQKNPADERHTLKCKKTLREKFISRINVTSKDPLDDADSVYEGNEDILDGVYVYQQLVFVVVSVDLNEKHDIEPEGVAMLKENRMLRKKFNLSENFSLNRNIIKNEENDDSTFYQYVTAYRLKDVVALQQANRGK